METYISCLISILLIVSCVGLINAKFFSQTIARQRLVQDLFTNYNPSTFPAHKNTRIDLTLHINFYHFNFRPNDGRFEFFGKLNVSWPDHKLHWKPMDYNNVSEVYVPRLSIWIPDLEFYNNAPDKFLCMKDNGLVLVESTGRVTWVETIEANIACEFETLSWPNDRHKCILKLGSWTHDGNILNFDNATRNSIISTKKIAKNPEFKILNHTVEYVSTIYSCCEEPYVTLNYILELERRASFAVIFQMPALCVIVLTLGAFCLESYRGEKLFLHGISIFLIVFQLVYFAQNMKQFQFAHKLPKCVIFHSISMVLVTFAVLLSVFALWASRSKSKGRLPPGFLKLLKSRLGSLLDTRPTHGLKPENSEEMHSQFEDIKLQEQSILILTDLSPDEWTRFAFVVERIAFGVYSLIFLILGSICFM